MEKILVLNVKIIIFYELMMNKINIVEHAKLELEINAKHVIMKKEKKMNV